ncbi:MAG TPA: phospholipase D family protein [Rhodanobacteraceae bacterium]|nr:phospholipase D family protein [Rhodanobacteraceae bacterium]
MSRDWRWSARIAVALLLAAALGGCAVSRQNVRRASADLRASIDHRLDCRAADHCAITSPLLDLGARARAQSQPNAPVNYAVLLDHGEQSLIARLNLIRAAHHSIDIQTYIWGNDDAGKLVIDELVRAARRGVKVRVLADQLGSFDSIEQLAALARTHVNFTLRLYNPTLHDAETQPLEYVTSAVCCFFQLNQRMHNKLLLVDDLVGITGGRNYENRYFDWDEGFDFRDRDVLVAGPVADAMARSFETFWGHPRSARLVELRDVNSRLRADGPGAPGWRPPSYDDDPRVEIALASALTRDYVQRTFANRAYTLGEVSYFADLPGKTRAPQRRIDHQLTAHLMGLIANTRHELVLQTPYLILSKKAQHLFRRLHRQRPRLRITVSTNSLASTDAFAVYALYHKYQRRYLVAFGFDLYEMKPHPAEAPWLVAHFDKLSGIGGARGSSDRDDQVPLSTRGVRISMHAKSMVVDGEYVMIGSHNFDPRSDHYNTESGIIVRNRKFAAAVRESILRDTLPGNAWVIARREADSWFGRLNRQIAELSAKLPIFDFWPIRYATSYQLKPGYAPVPPDDPRFFTHYEAVGEFPEVALPLKLIYARIITAFGAGISGFL